MGLSPRWWREEESVVGLRTPRSFVGQVVSRDAHLPPTVRGDDPDLVGHLILARASHCRGGRWSN
jgi:hypothetical protein